MTQANQYYHTTDTYDKQAIPEITPEMDAKIEELISETLDDYLDRYEPISHDAEFERNEYKARDGFIPFTNGGFNTLILYPASQDSSHLPNVFDSYINGLVHMCEREFYHDQTGEYPDSPEELSAWLHKLAYDDASEEADKELWYEYENEFMQSDLEPALQIEIFYYGRDNSRNPMRPAFTDMAESACVRLQICTNTDGPYYRPSRAILALPEVTIPVTPALPEQLNAALKNLLSRI